MLFSFFMFFPSTPVGIGIIMPCSKRRQTFHTHKYPVVIEILTTKKGLVFFTAFKTQLKPML